MPITLGKFSFELDLTEELEGVPRNKHKKVKSEIGKAVLRQINIDTRKQISPVDGERYAPLTKAYRERKKKLGKGSKPNLHLNNRMIPAIRKHNTVKGVKFEITRKKIIPQAFNINTGDTMTARQFLPDDGLGEEFRSETQKKIERIAAKHRDIKVTRRIELRRLDRELLEEQLIEALGVGR
ncbi:hypothetical protein IIB49_01905, partial [Patescibacteria group bacterium]|nr:hypothetical protein [Patescibacteria group bacterium]